MKFEDCCFASIWWGDKYPERYVSKLHSAVRRNCSFPLPFYCLTNQRPSLPLQKSEIRFVSAPNDLPGWWQKLNLFEPETLNQRHIVFLDLDVVILRNLNEIVDLLGRHEFVHAQDVLDTMSTSCMLIDTESAFSKAVASGFVAEDWISIADEGDQGYLGGVVDAEKYNIGTLKAEQHYSYKYLIDFEDWRDRVRNPRYPVVGPDEVTMLNFHGKPDPHDLEAQPQVWKYAEEILRHW